MSFKNKRPVRSTKNNNKKVYTISSSSSSRGSEKDNNNNNNSIDITTSNNTTSRRAKKRLNYNNKNNIDNNLDEYLNDENNDYENDEENYNNENNNINSIDDLSSHSPPRKKIKINPIKKKSIRNTKIFDKEFNQLTNKQNKSIIEKRTFNDIEGNRSIWSNFLVNEYGVEIIYYYKKSKNIDYINSHKKTHAFKCTIVEEDEFYYYYILSYNHYILNNRSFDEEYPLLKYFIDEKKFRFDMNKIKYKFGEAQKECLFHSIRCSIYINLLDKLTLSGENTILIVLIKLYFYDSILFQLNRKYISDKSYKVWSCITSQYHKILQSIRYKKYKKSILYYYSNNIVNDNDDTSDSITTCNNISATDNYIFDTIQSNKGATIEYKKGELIEYNDHNEEFDNLSSNSNDLLFFINNIQKNNNTTISDNNNSDTVSNSTTMNTTINISDSNDSFILKDFINNTLEESRFSDLLHLSESELESLFHKFEEDTISSGRESLCNSTTDILSIEDFEEIDYESMRKTQNNSNFTIHRNNKDQPIHRYNAIDFNSIIEEDMLFISELLDSLNNNYYYTDNTNKDRNTVILNNKNDTTSNTTSTTTTTTTTTTLFDKNNNINTDTTTTTLDKNHINNNINCFINNEYRKSTKTTSRKFKYLFNEKGKCNTFYRENVNINIDKLSKNIENSSSIENSNNHIDNGNTTNISHRVSDSNKSNSSNTLYDCDTDDSDNDYTNDNDDNNNNNNNNDNDDHLDILNYTNHSNTTSTTTSTSNENFSSLSSPSISTSTTSKRNKKNNKISKIREMLQSFPDEYERLFIIKNKTKLLELIKMYGLLEKIIYENEYSKSISSIMSYLSEKIDIYKDE